MTRTPAEQHTNRKAGMTATRADVARLAGVSPALVSYVMNNGPRPVSPEARARIERAIDTLNYKPNAIARALRGSETKMIGLLTPDTENPFFAELAKAIEQELFDDGYLLLVGITKDDPSRQLQYARTFLERKVDGLLILSSRVGRAMTELCDAVPTVTMDRTPLLPHASSVETDSMTGARRIVEHLQMHDIQLIGCIAGPPQTRVTEKRTKGWRIQQNAMGYAENRNLVAYASFTPQDGYEAAKRLFTSKTIADALRRGEHVGLFTHADVQALGAMHALLDMGIDVPGQVAIASFDGTQLSRHFTPTLTSYAQPVDEIAHSAVSELIRRIDTGGQQQQRRSIKIEGNLRIGGSCGCKPDGPLLQKA